MLKITLSAFATLLAVGLIHQPAHAQSRVFVAAQGSDSNPCTFAAPCRTFQHAHDTVAAGGEIDVLDPAGYGALTVSKSLSIQGHGYAGISPPVGGTGITVQASASSIVHLNGLLIDGGGSAQAGILFQSGSSLVIENCVLRAFSGVGINVTSSGTTTPTLSVSNSYLVSVAGAAIAIATASSGGVMATIERTAFFDNFKGLQASGSAGTGTIYVAVSDSVAANGRSAGYGFLVSSSVAQSATYLALMRSTITGNGGGGVVALDPNTAIWLSQTTIIGNTLGYSTNNGRGTIFSYGDNVIANNQQNTGPLTTATKQ